MLRLQDWGGLLTYKELQRDLTIKKIENDVLISK